MTKLLEKYGLRGVLRSAEGAGGGGGDGGAGGGEAPTPESVLFPGEGKGGEGEKPADPPAGEKPSGDWEEFVPDPAKSEAENAAAKVEHDKTKPADKNDPLDLVPEDGKYELTMPEGVEVDKQMLDAIGPKLQAKGYTRREAQELTDEFIKVQTAQQEDRMKRWGETLQQWVDDAKKDKEIGGDKWGGSVKNAHRFLGKFGTPELREYLNASGGGNHPELIRVFAKAGSMIREDNPATGGAEGAGKPADPAHVLFPNDAPKG